MLSFAAVEHLHRLGRTSLRITARVALLLALVPSDALAYFDPGTGSMVLQALFAVIMGLALTLRGLRARLVALARRLFRSGDED